MTKELLKENYPELYNEIFQEGKQKTELILKNSLSKIFDKNINTFEKLSEIKELVSFDLIETDNYTAKMKKRRMV